MSSSIYKNVESLKGFSLKSCGPMPEPGNVLMCAPGHFGFVEGRNSLIQGGTVNEALARRQWDAVKTAFEAAGRRVLAIESVAGLENMAFCANQTLVGLTPTMEHVCLLSQMRHPSRRREVPVFESWFKQRGYRIARLKDPTLLFEGAGDAIWHPGKRLLWGGHGFRSQPQAYEDVSRIFKAPVILLKLVNEKFYHLDTCFCPLTSESVLIYPSAFDAESLELILKIFPVVLTASETEASRSMACNAAVIDGKTAIVQRGTSAVARHMAGMGLRVVEVDTSEFIKLGGSVYCLKLFFY